MTAPGFAERFLFGEQKGKEKNNNTTHIIILSRKGREQPLLRSELHIIDLVTKQQNSHAEIFPNFPAIKHTCCQCVEPAISEIKTSSQKRGMWKQEIKPPPQTKLSGQYFTTVKDFSLVLLHLTSVTLLSCRILAFSLSCKSSNICLKFADTSLSLSLGKLPITYRYSKVLHLRPVLGLDLPFEVLGLSSFIRDCLKLSSV